MVNILESSRKSIVTSNLIWKFAERVGNQLVTFIITVVLARLLLPSEYGLIAMVTVIIAVANVFITNGISTSLIQKKDADSLDFSSIFYFNIGMSSLLYGIIYFIAPHVANFYEYEILSPVLRVIGLGVVVTAINSIQLAYVARNMIFKKLFYSTIGGNIVSAIVGIVLAYLGYGVWALVAQYLVNLLVNTMVLWVTVRWRPEFKFSLERVLVLLSFGWKILLTGLTNTLNLQFRQLVIGKIYSPSDLAFYNKGFQFPAMVMANIESSVSSVMFPLVSQSQHNLEDVKYLTRKTIRLTAYIVFPMLAGLAAVADPLIRLLLTDKWAFCIPYLWIGCFTYATNIIQIPIQNAIIAMGKSDYYLKIDIVRQLFSISIFLLLMRSGVLVLALGLIISSIFSLLLLLASGKRMFAYNYRENLEDYLAIIVASIAMGGLVYSIGLLGLSYSMTLTFQVVLGIITYLLFSILLHLEGYSFVLNFLKEKVAEFYA